jgi:predicted HicB family RNase H-like nuclease
MGPPEGGRDGSEAMMLRVSNELHRAAVKKPESSGACP